MGHEGSGVIAALGPGVTNWKVGDPVVLEPGIPCRKCEFCKDGNYHLCLSVVFAGVPPSDGIMAQYVTKPADFVFPMPTNLDFVHATLIEPLSVGLMAAHVADVQVGDSVAIFGSGPIGLTNLLAARRAVPPARSWSTSCPSAWMWPSSSAPTRSSTRAARTPRAHRGAHRRQGRGPQPGDCRLPGHDRRWPSRP